MGDEARRLGISVVEVSQRETPTSTREWNPDASRELDAWMSERKAEGVTAESEMLRYLAMEETES